MQNDLKAWLIGLLLLVCAAVRAENLPIPTDLYGAYAAHGNCQQTPRFIMNPQGAFIENDGIRTGPLTVDVCLTCAGGARYSGIERWLFIQSGKISPLLLRFNADEKNGHVEVSRNEANAPLSNPLMAILQASSLERCGSTPNVSVTHKPQMTGNAVAPNVMPAAKAFTQLLSSLLIPSSMGANTFYDWIDLKNTPTLQWAPLPPMLLDKPLSDGNYFKRNGVAKVAGQSLQLFASGARMMVMGYHVKNTAAPIGEMPLLSALKQAGFTVTLARCPIQPNLPIPKWYKIAHAGKQPAFLLIIPASLTAQHWEGFMLNLSDTLMPLTPAEQKIYTNRCPIQ